MANFLLTQTGEEVQTILNEAPETKEGLQQEVTNREQAITAEEQARNEAIAAAIEAAIVNYYTKTETDTKLSAYSTTTEMQQAIQTAITAALTAYSTTQDMNAAIATALGDYYTKAEVTAIASLIDDKISALASRVSDIENGETPAKLAENLESWAERGETPQNNEWTDKVRTTAGDMSIDSSRTSRLLSVIPLSPFYAQSLRATGFNLLHGAQAAGSGYYFEVPALTFGMINTAEENNGVLFTNQHGDNLRPTVYFKPLSEGVPQHANDGVVADYRDEGGYRFYLCSEPGYIVVSNITLEDTCAHIAWSRRYNEFISPDNAEDAGSSLPLASLIHAIHDYDLMLRAEMGEQYVYDELRANNGNVNWFRRVERIQPEWTTADNGDGTYTHTATIADMKANGIAECGSLALTVSGTTIAYTDNLSAPTGDYVLYQLSEPVSGIVEQDNAFSVEGWGLEILVDAQGDALITTQYYQSLPDAIAALLTKVPGLRTDLTEEINRRVADVVALQREINNEKTRAEGAERILQGIIDAEAQARQQADTVLDGKIADEKTRAQQAEQTLQQNINAEQQRAEGVEGDLQADIDDINAKIPAAASQQNQLADKEFVNSSIASHTGNTTVHITAAERTAWNAKQAAITDGAQIGLGYGVSSEAATTQARTATIASFILLKNMPVTVRFTTAVNATNATLNISSTGAKPIYIDGNALQPGVIRPGMVATMIYDGTKWNIVALQGLEQSAGRTDYMVDMGLPSGLLWADRNIDATQPDGFCESPFQYEGSFFSWGNTEPHNPTSTSAFGYDWGTGNDGPYASTPGAKLNGNMAPSQDIVRAICGAPFRLPTTGEFAELFANIDYVQADGETVIDASQANKLVTVNSVVGIYLKSKINGKRLFFPCSGNGYGSSWYNRGSIGNYWSSSLYSAAYGRHLYFYSGGVSPQGNGNRFDGFAGRAVQ